MHLLVVLLALPFSEIMALLLGLLLVGESFFCGHIYIIVLFIGAWLGFRAVNPYHSLLGQINGLNNHQRQNLTDEIRRTVGSSSVDNLLRYVS
jgi:ABC-type multidrug transport system permease subunit